MMPCAVSAVVLTAILSSTLYIKSMRTARSSISGYKLGETWELNLFEIEEAITEAPAADVQPVKRGKWKEHHAIYIKQLDICLVRAKCSYCGRYSDKVDDYIPYLDLEYCSHCGADMSTKG